jgi:hypothetical protein
MTNVSKNTAKLYQIGQEVSKITSALQEAESSQKITQKKIASITDSLFEVCKGSEKVAIASRDVVFLRQNAENLLDTGRSLAGRLQVLEGRMLEKDLDLLEGVENVSKELSKLLLEKRYLPYEVLAERISFYANELNVLSKENQFNHDVLDSSIHTAYEKLYDLHFRYEYPIVEELEVNPLQQTFASKSLKTKESLKLLQDMKELVSIAKEMTYFDVREAVSKYDNLSDKSKIAIDQILWQLGSFGYKDLREDIFVHRDVGSRQALTKAVMMYVSSSLNN